MAEIFDQNQQRAVELTSQYRAVMEQVGHTLWARPEVGLEEYHSAALLIDLFRREGFRVTAGIGGFPTGFVAEFGQGGPVAAILCEYDALPNLSTTNPGANGHGCGHNLFAAAAVGTALVLRDVLKEGTVPGTIRVYGTPGEENYASKAYYVNQGLMDDVDFSVGFHAHDENKVNYTVSAGTLTKSYTFHGKPAHAGNYPWLGNSALDAVELMNVACNYLREHVPTDVRIQYIITKGGDAPNIVPEIAQSLYVVRAACRATMDRVADRVDDCAHAAALATGCTVDIDYVDRTYNTVLLREYAELAQKHLDAVGAPAFTQEELENARQYGDGSGLHQQITPLPWAEGYQGGATDEGDVSWIMPHVSIYVSNVARNTPGHTLQMTAQGNCSAAYTAMETQVKAISTMILDLFEHPQMVETLKAAHEKKLAGDRYPKNPSYWPDPKAFLNCQGVEISGQKITADFSQLILLPESFSGQVTVEKDGAVAASFTGSGSASSQIPLAEGDSLTVVAVSDDGSRQLIGYWNL
ncbi:amidohydrolase [Angelakisella massiliensis]|uniref:amidohydrolase n=1 Tax=Angelakisella massiliensis TaxID=1871018 RepID=UPI0023A8370C|nr:amidohydrolase [Angelakisella massiliensis]